MTISDKNRTNRKWTSDDKYRNNFDKIFKEVKTGNSDDSEEKESTETCDNE